MKIINNFKIPEKYKKSAIAIGNFDGIHLGHKELLNQLSKQKKERNLKTVALTFFPNPKAFILRDAFEGHINSREDKIKLLENFNIDLLCI